MSPPAVTLRDCRDGRQEGRQRKRRRAGLHFGGGGLERPALLANIAEEDQSPPDGEISVSCVKINQGQDVPVEQSVDHRLHFS